MPASSRGGPASTGVSARKTVSRVILKPLLPGRRRGEFYCRTYVSGTGRTELIAFKPTLIHTAALSVGKRHRRKVHRKARAFADLRMDVQGAFGLFDEALDDI